MTTLIVFSGLPGVGKTTIARLLAARLEAVYLRIDTIEQAVRAAGIPDVGAAVYTVANELAASNLELGRTVVADCVNPVAASRAGWRGIAARTKTRLSEIVVVCSDKAEHRRRIEGRIEAVSGCPVLTWDMVTRRNWEPWDGVPHVLIDSATCSP